MRLLFWFCTSLALLACGTPPPAPRDDLNRPLREACYYEKGALPSQTLPPWLPQGDAMPFDHIVLVMQENRSFDHYFSQLSHGDVRVAPLDATNPDKNGVPMSRYHEYRYCLRDLAHGWRPSHQQFNDGAMDGFVTTNEPEGSRAMAWYDESDLPFYYALARTFAMSDAHFSSVMGPTQPNRMFYWAGTSWGMISNNVAPSKDPDGNPTVSIFHRLNKAGIEWRSYVTNVASPAVFIDLITSNAGSFRPIENFAADAMAGDLPPVSVVEASFGEGVAADESDEHPEANIQYGQQFTARVVDAVLKSPLWPRTVMFLLYDEHGGFYDSVPPPRSCEPDGFLPINPPNPADRFDQLGFRTPLIAISPYAKRGYVSHEPVDHTAVTRFVETRFGLAAMTRRDANAWPLYDMFDFESPDESVPELPAATIDAERDARCKIDFPP